MRRALLVLALLLGVAAPQAHAANGKPPSAAAIKAAAAHFKKARDLYEAGDYKEAIVELQTARALDPHAKDLVYNLGLVNEKLGDIDQALHFYKLYLDMDIEPAERARAEGIIKRLEGARTQVEAPPAGSATAAPTATVTVVVPGPPPPPPHGRVDALTITSLVIAVGGIGVGTTFGILALSDKPKNNYVTGSGPGADGTYAQLQAQADQAHTEGIIADVGFIVGVVGTGATLAFFFGRTKDKKHPPPALGFAPTRGGAAVVFGGTF